MSTADDTLRTDLVVTMCVTQEAADKLDLSQGIRAGAWDSASFPVSSPH